MNDDFLEFDLSESDEKLLDQFEAEFHRSVSTIEEFLSQLSLKQINASVLLELALLEMELRYKAGDFVRAEAYFARFPTLVESPELMVRVIFEEYRLLQDQVGPKFESYLQRFPQLRIPLLASVHELKGTFSFTESNKSSSSKPEFLSHYEIIEQVGQGACGTVYKAKDQLLGRIVAIKKLRTSEQSASQYSAVLNEARNAAQLTHPHIVPLFEAIITDQLECLIVYQFIEGSSLATILGKTSIPCTEAASWILNVAQALESAHSLGILHLDVKPSNILLDNQRKIWLCDFGLSRRRQEAQMQANLPLEGTLAYMSPEQAGCLDEPIDERSDIYGLGVVLFELLTGRLPLQGNRQSLLKQLQSAVAPPRPRDFKRQIHPDLEQICLKAIDRCPAQRYQSARDMADDLQRYLTGQPTHARPLSKTSKLVRWGQRNSLTASLALLVLVAGLVGTTAFGLQWRIAVQQQRLVEKGTTSLYNALATIVQTSSEAALRDPNTQEQMRSMLTVAKDSYEQALVSDLNTNGKPNQSARALQGLGTVFNQLGDYNKAIQAFDEAQSCLKDHGISEDNVDLAIEIALGKATSYRRSGDKQLALPLYYFALKHVNEIASSPTDCAKRTAEIAWYIAEAELSIKNFEVAKKMASTAYGQWSYYHTSHSSQDDSDCVMGIGKSTYIMATCDFEMGQFTDAANGFQLASKHFKDLSSRFPKALNFKRDLAASLHNQARSVQQLGQNDLSAELYRQAIDLRRFLVDAAPENQLFISDLNGSESSLNQLQNAGSSGKVPN